MSTANSQSAAAPNDGCTRALAAISSGDLTALQAAFKSTSISPVSYCGGDKRTLLHYAAMYGSRESVTYILSNTRIDTNAQDQFGATALLYGAYDAKKTLALIREGAETNIASSAGMTPLMVAASVHNSLSSVRELISAGARIADTNSGGTDALMFAASNSDPDVLRLLLRSGANARRLDKSGSSALMRALEATDRDNALILIHAGAPVNGRLSDAGTVAHGNIRLRGLTPLMMAAPYADPVVIRQMLYHGASVNSRDMRGMTALMLAVATDHANPQSVRLLLQYGADTSLRDETGKSAADWAANFPNSDILRLLGVHDMPHEDQLLQLLHAPPLTPEIVMRSTSALIAGSTAFSRSGDVCIGCHTQGPVASAYTTLSKSHQRPSDEMVTTFAKDLSTLSYDYDSSLPQMEGPPGDFDLPLILLNTLADLQIPPSRLTNELVQYVALRQEQSGAWNIGAFSRPPLQDGSIVRTSLAIRALRRYAIRSQQAEFDKRIKLGLSWLKRAHPVTTFEIAEVLMSVTPAPHPTPQENLLCTRLLKHQNLDGGWAQVGPLRSDAFSTGIALIALQQCGYCRERDSSIAHGVQYLVNTQQKDGTWHIDSRAPKVQPYFESSFPYGPDQWLSTIGTVFAVQALSLQLPHSETFDNARVANMFAVAEQDNDQSQKSGIR